MLERLRIRDLALVERAEVSFEPGLNCLTGETGAGKSLVVQAVDWIVGSRVESDALRAGASQAVVEAEFSLEGRTSKTVATLLEQWGVEFDGRTLLVRREVSASGRGRATVNESAVTLASLKRLGETLADLHGQHEHQSLLRPEAGRATLDRLARLEADRARFEESLAEWRAAESDARRLEDSLADLAERGDFLRHAARELDEARLVAGEERALAEDAARLAHADRLRALSGEALERVSEAEGSALSSLGAAGHALEQAAALDPSLAEALAAVREAEIAAGEAGRALSLYSSRLDADPDALEAIEARRDLIARLTRKYRRDVAGLLAWREELARELSAGDDASAARAAASASVERTRAAALSAGRSLAEKRRSAASEWGPRLTRELKPLGLGPARLAFELEPQDVAGVPGLEEVALRFSANPGEPPRPLQRIASGGELSRVMLAIKAALEERDPSDLLVFDEVDSGIGGAVAQAVGERLRALARHRQIVCVTHLPLVAALATRHLCVTKRVAQGRTVVRIEPVEGPSRIDELARMLAGQRATETTRRQARELLEGIGSPAPSR